MQGARFRRGDKRQGNGGFQGAGKLLLGLFSSLQEPLQGLAIAAQVHAMGLLKALS